MDKKYFPIDSFKGAESQKSRNLSPMKLFGNRVFNDQSILETLCEFLNVVKSEKTINNGKKLNDEYFPEFDYKKIQKFEYSDDDKLKLKLFSLYTCSCNGEIHPSHKQYFNELYSSLEQKISITDRQKISDKTTVIDIIENLFMGFQGVGVNRDWCAQSFLPVRKEFLAGETIWKATESRRISPDEKDIKKCITYFARASHNLYARSGEVLYLEMFIALQKSEDEIKDLAKRDFLGINFSDEELNPYHLKEKINTGLTKLLEDKSPSVLGRLANFIDNLEPDDIHDNRNKENMHSIGWIPIKNWKYGYLFAVELSRLFDNEFDIVEELEMIQILITLHTLRRFVFVSSEYLNREKPLIAVIDVNCQDKDLKSISKSSYISCRKIIEESIKKYSIGLFKANDDKKYGSGVFNKLAKSIDFVVPKTGDSSKFVMTNDILNCLLCTTLLPKEQMRLDSFLDQLKLRFGFVFDRDNFNLINQRLGKQKYIFDESIMDWFIQMLSDSGYLIQLSDSVSLVKNISNKSK